MLNDLRWTLVLFSLVTGSAQGAESFSDVSDSADELRHPSLGGPDSVANQMESDRADRDVLFETTLLKPIVDWQAGVRESSGLSFGSDYTSVYLASDGNLPDTDDHAAGGMIRFFGTWDLIGRDTPNTGTLVYKFDHRHSYTDTAPADFSIDNLGYVDSMASTFSDQGWRLTTAHWRQSWNHGRVVALGGLLSVPDFVDLFALGSPWLHFQSLAFSTGAGTMSLPGDAALGVAVGGWVTEHLYIMGGLEDANSLSDDPLETFDTFFDKNEYFKHIEIGWTTAEDRAYVDNVHVTLWHADRREEAGVPEGWGAIFSFTHYIGDRWMPFFRAGYAKDGASLLERSVSAGFAFQPNPIGSSAGNLLGFGANWGRPNEAVFEPGLDDQYHFETFFRLQVTKEFAVTPHVQFLRNPALAPERNSSWVFGLRARVAL